jgi:hypothetical protein
MATVSRATWFGLFLSLFAMVVIRYVVVYFAYEITFGSAILKETLIWVSAAALLVIVRRGERLPFSSIGLGTSRWWKSIVWGVVTAGVLAVVGVVSRVVVDEDQTKISSAHCGIAEGKRASRDEPRRLLRSLCYPIRTFNRPLKRLESILPISYALLAGRP